MLYCQRNNLGGAQAKQLVLMHLRESKTLYCNCLDYRMEILDVLS